jgi:hypothetical protein
MINLSILKNRLIAIYGVGISWLLWHNTEISFHSTKKLQDCVWPTMRCSCLFINLVVSVTMLDWDPCELYLVSLQFLWPVEKIKWLGVNDAHKFCFMWVNSTVLFIGHAYRIESLEEQWCNVRKSNLYLFLTAGQFLIFRRENEYAYC